MDSIISAFRTGSAKERLAIAADLTSIVGVSIASTVGGLFAIAGSRAGSEIDLSQVAGAAIFSLIFLSGAVLVLAAFLTLMAKLDAAKTTVPLVRKLAIFSAWMLMLALTLLAAGTYYSLISSFSFTR